MDRLLALDERETARQRQRADFLSLLDAVIEALPDSLIVTTLEGEIIIFNERAELMFGYHRSEVIGKTVEMLIPERDRAGHIHDRMMYSRFDVSKRSSTMGIGMNLLARHSDGHEFSTEITLARMVVPKGVYIMALARFSPHHRRSSLPEPCSAPQPPAKIEDVDA
jgi:protein-histidine pros-kinase